MRKFKAIRTIKGDIVKNGKRQTYFTKGKVYNELDNGERKQKGWVYLTDDLGDETQIVIDGNFKLID